MSILQSEGRFSETGRWDEDAFSFYLDDISQIIEKIDSNSQRLDKLFLVGSGMQTGSNKVYLFKKPPDDIPEAYLRKRISGENIDKYVYYEPSEQILFIENIDSFEDLDPAARNYLVSHKKVLQNRADKKRRKSAKWWTFTFPMHIEHYAKDKIWCSYRSPENRFCLDHTGKLIGLTNTTVIFKSNESLDFRWLLALLNSECLNFRYRYIGKKTGSGLLEYFENGVSKLPIRLAPKESQRLFGIIVEYVIYLKNREKSLLCSYFEQLIDGLVYELYFPEEVQAAGKEILPHLGDLPPVDSRMSEAERLAIIQRKFDRLYDPNHPVRNHLETLESVPVVKTIRDALKR